MRPTQPNQTAFTAGEISPELFGRIEVAKYYSGAAYVSDLLVRPQGGVRRRPGMEHCATLSDGLDGVRLIPFAFNVEQTYLFVFTAGAFRVYLPDGTLVFTSTGQAWTASQAAEFNYTQSADTLLLFHRALFPIRIRRGGSSAVWLSDLAPLTNIPQFDYGAGLEPVINASRGYPECGCFHQGRLWMGGLNSRPSTLLASQVGQFFDFTLGTGLDSQGIMASIDTNQVNAIHQISSGKALQIFTAGAELAETNNPITPGSLAIREQTRRGITRFMPLVEVDGATLFGQRGGGGIREFIYQDLQQVFDSNLLSLLAGHLMFAPRDMAARKRAAGDDADHIIILNTPGATRPTADGALQTGPDAILLTTLRSQEVTAFTRWNTAGDMMAVAALDSGEVFFATLRAGSIRIEKWNDQRYCDASVVVTGAALTSIPAQPHLLNQPCDLVLDGLYAGQVTPGAGTIALPYAANRVEIGLSVQPLLRTMPLEPRDPSGAALGKLCRVTRVTARLLNSGPIAINAQPARPFREGVADLPAVGELPDLYTGDVAVHALRGWRERHQVEVTQTVPGPLLLLALSHRFSIGGDGR